MPARRDFARSHASAGDDDFSSTVMTTIVAIGVLGYIISRLFRKGPTAAAGNAAATANNAVGAAGPRPLPPQQRGAGGGAATANNSNMTLEERMATLAFAGWKVAVDVDALVSRQKGTSDTEPALREADNSAAYFKNLLAAGADTYVYCQVDRDTTKVSNKTNYVGDVHAEFVGQQELVTALKPFAANGLLREQVLFCSTSKGHEAFSRQLQPTILITTRASVVDLLARHVPYIVYVDVNGAPLANKYSNVMSVDSLGRFSS